MLAEVQGSFRKGRNTEDNLFIMERIIEIARMKKKCMFVTFLYGDGIW